MVELEEVEIEELIAELKKRNAAVYSTTEDHWVYVRCIDVKNPGVSIWFNHWQQPGFLLFVPT